MSVGSTDLVFYGSANMPEDNESTAGGAIDTTVRVIPDDASLFNAPGGLIEMVSDNGADTMNVTITGRTSTGQIVAETKALNGTTAVDFTTTFERILKIVLASAAAGEVLIRQDGGGDTIVTIESGVTTIRRPFYNVSSDAAGGASRDFYEKIFLKNNNADSALLGATIFESADPSANITFNLESGINTTGSVASRLNTVPSNMLYSFDGNSKQVFGGDLLPQSGVGVWLKLTLAAGASPAKSTYTMAVSGTTI